MEKLLYKVTWSFLLHFSKSLLGRALFLIFLTPVIVYLVRFLELVGADSVIMRIKMSVVGAIIFLVSYLNIRILTPKQIKEHSSSSDFSKFAKDNIPSVTEYFKEIEELLERYGDYCSSIDKQRLIDILPPSEAVKRLGKQGASLELAKAHYELLDCSKPISRNVIALMLSLSGLLLISSILRCIYIILLE